MTTKESAAPVATGAARERHTAATPSVSLAPNPAPTQQPSLLAHVGSIWKSPRDRSRAIQFDVKQFKGSSYLDIRLYEAGRDGRMQRTATGITVSTKQLAKFADHVGKSYRQAVKLGLTQVSS
jgi:hypothetical protein